MAVGTLIAMMNLVPRSAFPGWFPARQVSMGLDLRGGSYLLLEVDLNTVVRERLDGMIEGARTRLRSSNVRYVNLAADPALEVRLLRGNHEDRMEAFLDDPQSLEVKVAPPSPTSLLVLMAGAANPAGLISALGLAVEANTAAAE